MSKSKKNGKFSNEEEETSQPNRRRKGWNPFKRGNGEKNAEEKYEVPLVDFEPDSRQFVYDDSAFEVSDVATPVSPHSLKLFAAIREEELELVEEELANRTENQTLDELGKEGFALIHVAARYNMTSAVNSLLDYGAKINISAKDSGWRPLHLAAR